MLEVTGKRLFTTRAIKFLEFVWKAQVSLNYRVRTLAPPSWMGGSGPESDLRLRVLPPGAEAVLSFCSTGFLWRPAMILSQRNMPDYGN
jgi:hypothetical protein